MALKKQMGLGGMSAQSGRVRVRVTILDLHGDPLFGTRSGLYLPGAHMAALAHARYWLRRGGCLVRISDENGQRARTFRRK